MTAQPKRRRVRPDVKPSSHETLKPGWKVVDGKVQFGRGRNKATRLEAGYCGGDCHAEVIAIPVTYEEDNPHFFMGISEYKCPVCGRREGRWTRRVLEDGEFEPKFGEREPR